MVAADIPAALARTLQGLRAERGWSLDQLAARSGLSKGVLVSLEPGRWDPDPGTLGRAGAADDERGGAARPGVSGRRPGSAAVAVKPGIGARTGPDTAGRWYILRQN